MKRLATITYNHVGAQTGFAICWEARYDRQGERIGWLLIVRLWRTLYRWRIGTR
jgi:hypothetical protein